jgi:hypothetical protein
MEIPAVLALNNEFNYFRKLMESGLADSREASESIEWLLSAWPSVGQASFK